MIKSNVLEKGEMKLLKEWVGSKKLKMEKIYDVNEHGDAASDFWGKVKDFSHCFVLMKSKQGKRWGGYRSVAFT